MKRWLTGLFAALTTVAAILTLDGGQSELRAQTVEEAQPAEPSTLPASSAIVDPEIPPDQLAHLLVPLTVTELEAVAERWLQIVASETEVIAQRQVRFLRNPDAATSAAYADLARLVEIRAGTFQRFSMVVDQLEAKGGDEALVKQLRDYRSAVLSDEASMANLRALLGAFLTWLTRADGGLVVAWGIGILALSLLALVLVARLVRGVFRRWLNRTPGVSTLLQKFLVTAMFWAVLTVGFVLVLAMLGVNVTPLFAMIGGVSFILAFALQDTLGNLASGLMIMINRPFDEGDYVSLKSIAGTVKSTSIVSTTLATPDNQIIVVPNKNVWGDIITNVTASTTRRVDMVFGISYEDDISKAIQVVRDLVLAHPLVLRDPEPVIRVNALSDSSVDLICRPWVKRTDYWATYWDLIQQVKEGFDAADISIPYPQRDVHMIKKGQ
ncbi:mechanosensitive ion channel family protein [Bauldia sp.]|uniref:mechanosensitive ion channel family protein n=1 Tax=Bauldia sp. TaxID=2575872 RepID=UPI003BA85F5A